MHYKKIVLSPCGTSMLTNYENRKHFGTLQLPQYANLQQQELESEIEDTLVKGITMVEQKMLKADVSRRKQFSAELNALYTLEKGVLKDDTTHLLLVTDTYLGTKTADIVEKVLRADGVVNVQKVHIADMRTKNVDEFRVALSELVRYLEETLPGYKEKGYEVIFNLTGGFKSIQGFLQSIAPFYADRSVYIFESGNALLSIPSLPVKQNNIDVIEAEIYIFRRLYLGMPVAAEEVEKLPEIYWWRLEDEYDLTEWGMLSFQRAAEQLYAQKVFPAPSNKIEVPEKLLQELSKNLNAKRIREFNRTMDDLARNLETGKMLKSSTFKKLQGTPKGVSTHECYLNSDDAERIFCHYHDSVLLIDEVGKHL